MTCKHWQLITITIIMITSIIITTTAIMIINDTIIIFTSTIIVTTVRITSITWCKCVFIISAFYWFVLALKNVCVCVCVHVVVCVSFLSPLYLTVLGEWVLKINELPA